MSDNKFIQRLKGKQTPKSVVEVQNDKLVAPFTGVPNSTDVVGAIIDDKDSSVVVAKGAQNWKLNGSSLVVASSLSGDGADYTGEFNASGSSLWINATYSLPATIFNAGTKWVLKLCGKNLLTTSGETIDFTLMVKVGNTHITTKAFTVAECANVFCRQLVIDFSESEQAVIKAQSGDSLTLQLLCADANASATIYNGMTVLTALQRKVDGDSVASNTRTFDELEEDYEQFVIDTQTALDGKVNIDGTSIMTAPLKFAAGSMRGAVGPYLNGVSFWKMNAQYAITNIANLTDSQFLPVTTNSIDLGRSANKWKDLYLAGKAYVATINNGADIAVPTTGGTFALLSDLDTKQDLLVAGDNIVMSSLPVGYKRLNYIESSGTQSINTNVAVNLGNSFELDCAFLSGNVSGKHMISQGNNSLRIGATNMTWFSQAAHFMAGFTVAENLKIECGLNYLTVNGTSITGTTDSDTVGGTYAYLFGKNDGSAYCLARVKSAKIYNSSNVLVFDGIPALRESDSAVGLYDNVSGSFFGSTSADNFIAGDVVGSVVISAVIPDALPDQTGNSGKFLTTNGTAPLWATIDALPDQTGNSGKYLTTDGTSASWGTFPVINYSINGGNYTAGTGSYAITRFSLMLQKPNGTWEKPTDTSMPYSQATDKTVNTNGFLLNHILYYNYTSTVFTGQLTGLNRVYSKHATVPMSYSTNCGATPGWALGTWIYLVGTLGADGLFYLDTTQWWSDALPITNDGKLYIRLGPASSSTGDTVALLEDRPIFYHDGNEVKEYYPGGNGGATHEVIEFQEPTALNNYTWYRKYRDGWVEQGGFVSNVSGEQTVNFPITMADTNYTMFKTMTANTSNNVQYSNVSFYTRTTASAKTRTAGADFSWYVCGMAA